ncbi:hypothetical protein PVK06_012855 [Gossypium arboreum]|uniref:Uncharacterized protein n=1 Tax=Gossypium arboreum TaxID=29729 RepID=A0ABR0QCL0_GOSAR|nr:hypothetical protein PVK06_012855 [Gossypium arboreum]
MGLGLRDISANQAWDLMDQDVQEEVAQKKSIAPGSCSRTLVTVGVPNDSNDGVVFHVEGESSAYRSALTLNGCDRKKVVVEVGSLDSGKRLAELSFLETKINDEQQKGVNLSG